MKTPGQEIIEEINQNEQRALDEWHRAERNGAYFGFVIGALLTFVFMVWVTR